MRERRRPPFWVAWCSARFKVRKGGLGSHIAGPVEPVKSCKAAIAQWWFQDMVAVMGHVLLAREAECSFDIDPCKRIVVLSS